MVVYNSLLEFKEKRFFEPPKRSGWEVARRKGCVTCRPLRSPKDPVLRLRSYLASPQNAHFCEMSASSETVPLHMLTVTQPSQYT
jgi:hypothetical protein